MILLSGGVHDQPACRLLPDPKPLVSFSFDVTFEGKTPADIPTITERFEKVYDPSCETFYMSHEIHPDADGSQGYQTVTHDVRRKIRQGYQTITCYVRWN